MDYHKLQANLDSKVSSVRATEFDSVLNKQMDLHTLKAYTELSGFGGSIMVQSNTGSGCAGSRDSLASTITW